MSHSLKSIDKAQIVALVLDATDGLSGQFAVPKVPKKAFSKYNHLLSVLCHEKKSGQEKSDTR